MRKHHFTRMYLFTVDQLFNICLICSGTLLNLLLVHVIQATKLLKAGWGELWTSCQMSNKI